MRIVAAVIMITALAATGCTSTAPTTANGKPVRTPDPYAVPAGAWNPPQS
jgi:hypothetical protein